MSLEGWLDRDDAPEADWAPHVVRLAATGGLGRVRRLLLDLPALGQPWGCRSDRCAPGRRARNTRSCCADLEVGITPGEHDAIAAALPEVARALADDPRWSAGIPVWHRDGSFARPGGRCVFARATDAGLSCALHETDIALKPVPCRLFPLAVVDLGDGRRLLSAVHRRTARHLGSGPATRFPCLGTGDVLARVERDTIAAFFGAADAERIAAAAEAWAHSGR